VITQPRSDTASSSRTDPSVVMQSLWSPVGSPSSRATRMLGLRIVMLQALTSASVHIRCLSRLGWPMIVLPSARTNPRSSTIWDTSQPS